MSSTTCWQITTRSMGVSSKTITSERQHRSANSSPSSGGYYCQPKLVQLQHGKVGLARQMGSVNNH